MVVPHRIVDGVCTGVTINELATFTVEVTVTECTEELVAGPKLYVCIVQYLRKACHFSIHTLFIK